MPHPVLEAAARFRTQALARERAAATQLVRAYGQVYRTLDPQIMALEEAIAGMESPSPGQITRLHSLRVLRAQVVEQVNHYAIYADTTIAQQVQANIAAGLNDSRLLVESYFDPAWLRANGLRLNANVNAALRASWTRVPAESVEALLGMLQPDSPLRRALVDRLGDVVAERMAVALVSGIARGLNPRALVRESLAQGLTMSLTTARTAQLWAYREATRASYMANRDIVSGWRWMATLGPRTCASCLAMHGTLHPVDEPLNDHHNGRCVAAPVVPLAARLGIPEPDMGDAEAYLQALPEAQARAHLGAGVYEEWAAGRVKLADLTTTYEDAVYGAMRRAPTLAELTAVPA